MQSAQLVRSVAVLGDVTDAATWSGTGYHFWRAATRTGFVTAPMRLPVDWIKWPRRRWAIGRLVGCRRPAGYQYSQTFLDQAESRVPRELLAGDVVSFSQHFPRAATVKSSGGRISYYIDATLAAMFSGRGLELRLPRDVVQLACELERENYRLADRVVTMARWAADSVIYDCGIAAEKVVTILPGANVELSNGWSPPARTSGRPGRDRPFVLGFVGKDWKRKGLALVCDVRDRLARDGWCVAVRAAGVAPPELVRRTGVEFSGFLDKSQAPTKFMEFLASCDVGCLFSRREALGISTLEFLRAGVPVAGYALEGPNDTLPPDAGFRFAPQATAEQIANVFSETLHEPHRLADLAARARDWSTYVTWERCVEEFRQVWAGVPRSFPVCPWQGLRELARMAKGSP